MRELTNEIQQLKEALRRSEEKITRSTSGEKRTIGTSKIRTHCTCDCKIKTSLWYLSFTLSCENQTITCGTALIVF